MDAQEHSAKKLIETTELQRHTRRWGQITKSSPVLALWQIIRIRNESHAFVKGNWKEKHAIAAELEQKLSKQIGSRCKKREREKYYQTSLATMQG